MNIAIPDPSLVLLVGPSGAGKSTFAKANFRSTEIVSSDAMRAMLTDGHRNANLMNADGDSVLIVALRHGALATARLLIAYGADVGYSGSGGWSAMDYANYWGDPELIRAVSKGA